MSEIDFENDAAEIAAPSNDQLSEIALLAQRQLDAENLVAKVEQDLKDANRALKKVREEDLPTAMKAVGLKEFKLSDGSKITVTNEVYASITKANEPKAFGWLEENGHGSIIKQELKLAFGKDEEARAAQLKSLLDDGGYDYSTKRAVNPQTLKAFVKEELAKPDGTTLPEQVFSVHRQDVSKVERAG